MSTALKTHTLLETLGPGVRSRPLRAVDGSADRWLCTEEPEPPQHSRFRLHRESEVPRLLAASQPGGPIIADSSASPDGRRPDELATFRQERRQMIAISRVVCQAVAEVLAGLRPAQQLNRWLAPEVQEKVRQRSQIHARHRTGTSIQASALAFGSIRTTRTRAGAWELSVVFSDEHRTRACAMRLQAHRRRWRVTAMELG